jgi:hypothetical protein
MTWPLPQDYNEAIQSPRSNFTDDDLRNAEPVCNALGIPLPCSGNFADVYQMRSARGSWAVKCFTREVPGLRERYAAISEHLRDANLPFTVDFTFLEKGIRVRGQWYPVLKMQWVEGLTLNAFVRQYADKPAMMKTLLQIWVRMAVRLREADIAHTDLQHGNVLLVPGSTAGSLAVKLIDYDGMWVPALAKTPSGEAGHPCYQHPQRVAEQTYSRELDRFPLLLIATALDCLRVGGQALWGKHDSGDNLLFREADLRAPVKSPLFYELLKLADERASRLARQTLDALKGRLESAPLLAQVLPEPHAAPAPAPKPAAVSSSQATVPAATADSPWGNLDGEEEAPKRRRRSKGGTPRWVWGVAAAGVAALVLVGGIVALATRGDSGKKQDTQHAEKWPIPPNPPTPPQETLKQFIERVALLPPESQRNEVAKKLKELNPGFDGQWTEPPGIEGDKIVSLAIHSEHVSDLRPLKALPYLRRLTLGGTKVTDLTPLQGLQLSYLHIAGSPVSDLSPLSEMTELEDLHVTAAPLTDLKPLQGLKLRNLTLHATSVEDLSPLKGMPLKGLNIHRTRVKDLSPLKGMKLEGLCYYEQPIKDISVLKDMPLRAVECTFQRERDEAVLRSIKTLKTINRKPKDQFWEEVTSNTPAGKDGFVALFDGTELSFRANWMTHRGQPGNWRVEKGTNGDVLTGSGSAVSHLYSERGDYKDFVLRVEARINDGGSGGVYSRASFGPFFPKAEPRFPLGYQAPIKSTRDESPDKTGSLYAGDDVLVGFTDSPVPSGEWFWMEVIAEGDHIIVKVKDKLGRVTAADWRDKKHGIRSGHIALQQLGAATVVEFRKIEIKELSGKAASPKTPEPPAKDGFVQLFNGKNLDGWGVDGGIAEQWSVEGDTIVGRSHDAGTRSYLLTDKEYANFVLRFDFKVEDGHHGVAIQAIKGEKMPLSDGLIFDHPLIKLLNPAIPAVNAKEPTGTTHWLKSADAFVKPSELLSLPRDIWHSMEVDVRGDRCTATIGSKRFVNVTLDRGARKREDFIPGLQRAKGKVGFQANTGTVRFRNIAIKELPAESTPSRAANNHPTPRRPPRRFTRRLAPMHGPNFSRGSMRNSISWRSRVARPRKG